MAKEKSRRVFDSLFEDQKPKNKRVERKAEAPKEVEVVPAEIVSGEDITPTQDKGELSIVIPEEKMLHRTNKMACNTCFLSDRCPVFKEDSDCGVDWTRLFKGEFKPTNILESSAIILDLQLMRIQRGAHFEMFNEGIIDPELSKEITRYFDMLKAVREISDNSTAISITAKGEAAKKGGVLAQLLGLNS